MTTTRTLDLKLPESLQPVLVGLVAHGFRPFVVGGAVRDALLGKQPHDFDVMVADAGLRGLELALREFGRVDRTGAKFLVLRLRRDGDEFEFALPRLERSVGVRRGDFEVERATPEQDAARRDFTINALRWDFQTGLVEDDQGGLADLDAGLLRATPGFHEDATRVLRLARFLAKFGFAVDAQTRRLCERMAQDAWTVFREMKFAELTKLLRTARPSLGLRFLLEAGWLDQLLPEVAKLEGVQQAPEHHPEGDAWVHTLAVVDAAAGMGQGDEFMWAALLHDVGKAVVTVWREGRWTSPGHADLGAEMAQRMLARLGAPTAFTRKVVALVREHMAFAGQEEVTPKAVRRLAVRLDSPMDGAAVTLAELAAFMDADAQGQGKATSGRAARLRAAAETLGLTEAVPQPLVHGRDLLAADFGLKPGPALGALLSRLMDAQLDGQFDSREAGLALAREWLAARGAE